MPTKHLSLRQNIITEIVTVQEPVPAGKVAVIIGKNGSTIKKLKTELGLKSIRVVDDRIVRIVGDKLHAELACTCVKALSGRLRPGNRIAMTVKSIVSDEASWLIECPENKKKLILRLDTVHSIKVGDILMVDIIDIRHANVYVRAIDVLSSHGSITR